MKNIKELEDQSLDKPVDETGMGVNSLGGLIINNNNSTLPLPTHPTGMIPPGMNSNDAKVKKIQAQEGSFDTLFGAELVAEFESLVIERQICFEKSKERVRVVRGQWRKAKEILCLVGLKDSSMWEMNAPLFYSAVPISQNYFQSCLGLMNKFGKFLAVKNRTFFGPILMPTGAPLQSMKARHVAAGGKSLASKPLTPDLLGRAKRELRLDHYNFLFITLWLGLRPSEASRLKDRASWKVETIDDVVMLSINQTKLSHLDPEARWKGVVIWEPQQKAALRLIQEGNFNRPLITTMKRVFGKGIYLYAGRKGFGSVMMDLKHGLKEISANLGHSSVKTTEDVYMDKEQVRLAKLRSQILAMKAVKG